jgi:tetratricopeptide (TPR) repeat protein
LSTRGGILCDIGKTQAGQADLKLYLALTESAHDVATRFRRACAFDDLKNYESARQEFQGVVNDTASATLDADLFNRGMAQINLEKHKEAIESLTKLNHVHSVAPRLVSWLAYCHSEVGQPDIALKQFAEVADQQPDYFSNQGGWGLALEKLKI